MLHRYFYILCSLIFLFSSIDAAQIKTEAISTHLVTGERIYVDFIIEGTRPSDPPKINVKGALFHLANISPYRRNQRSYVRCRYYFQSANTGSFIIPSTKFVVGSQTLYSSPVTLKVHPQSDLHKSSARVNGKLITYYTLTKANKASIYPNEHLPVEHKLYLPERSNIALWDKTSAEKKNCTAWRFQTPERSTPLSIVTLDQRAYKAASYKTTIAGVDEGKASLESINTRIVQRFSTISAQFGNRTIEVSHRYTAPPFEITVSPLPPNPPAGFKGDVGSFHMTSSTITEENITDADSVKALVQIHGSGGLHTLSPPNLTDSEHWKAVSVNKTDFGEDRKKFTGTAEFTYLLQPTGKTAQTPGFRFVYLDPILHTYRTLSQKGVPVNVTILPKSTTDSTTDNSQQNTTIPNNSETPSQLLGIIRDPQPIDQSWFSVLPTWWWHFIPATLVCFIVIREFLRRKKLNAHQNAQVTLRKKELKELEHEGENFLKASAAYAERWLEPSKEQELQEIIKLRDTSCFTPEGKSNISQEQRSSILKTLTKFSCILFCVLGMIQSSSANQEAVTSWENKDYNKALTIYKEELASTPSADTLYNIGNCYFKLGQPGQASLAYHRALLLDPEHPEAKQNLSFIEAPYDHSEPVILSDVEEWINYLTHETYLQIIFASLWVILLIFLTYKYLKPQRWKFITVTIIAILTPVVLGTAIYCYIEHPNKPASQEAEFAIVLEQSSLKPEPLNIADSIMGIHPTTKCTIVADRGSWTYIELPNRTRGWIRSSNIEAIEQ